MESIEEIKIKKPRIVTKILKKTGEVKTYSYDGAAYNKKYYQKNKDKILEKEQCDVCLGTYTINGNGLQIHNKTKKHILLLNRQNNLI